MTGRRIYTMIIFLIICGFVFGCGKEEQGNSVTNPQKETGEESPATFIPEQSSNDYTGGKVELLFLDENAGVSDEEFEEFYVKLVKSKYPDITVTKISGDIEELISAGMTPDLVTLSNAEFSHYVDLDYPQDLNEVVKRFNVDLKLFEPATLETLRGFSRDGSLIGLPFGTNMQLTLINEDIFDKFGYLTPDKVLLWEDYLDLVKKMTRKEDGIQYIGGNIHVSRMFASFGISNFDPQDKNVAKLTTDGHKRFYELIQQFVQIPDYIAEDGTYQYGSGVYFKEQRLAMYTYWLDDTLDKMTSGAPEFNWNVHTFPVFSEHPNTGSVVDFHSFMVSKVSKNQEAAYRVLLTMLDPETQIAQSRRGRLSSLIDPKIKAEFGKNSNVFEGKNLSSVLQVGSTPIADYTPYESEVHKALLSINGMIVYDKLDVNTALRQGEMLANQLIKEKLAAQ